MTAATKVRELSFSDLYLGHPTLEDRFSDVPGAKANPLPASPSLRSDLDDLIARCRHAFKGTALPTVLKIRHDDAPYRVSTMRTVAGDVFVVRKIAERFQSMTELGVPQAYQRHLMRKDLCGLFIIAGPATAGKSTTAGAMVKERLAAYGGVAITGESPVELVLEGSHGEGVCYQTAMPLDRTGFADGFQHLLRRGARTIFVDEIRNRHMAAQLLQESVSGHLIITTMLAESVVHAIAKLHAMAQGELDSSSARTLLAEGLAGVLHQQITLGPINRLEAQLLFFKSAPAMRAILHSGNYEMLESHILQQRASMISEEAVARRAVAI